MDTTKTTHISLCSGYGGIDLGLRRCIPGLRTIAYSEIEASAVELLLARMEGGQLDPAPIWSDLKSFPWGAFHGKVEILSGGYPCQPFSSAGKRAGKDDPRHLWPWIADGISQLQPRLCFFENVEGHISLGLSSVISDLEELGYRATWGLFSAAECGAPHQRKRVFIMAYYQGKRLRKFSQIRTMWGKVCSIKVGNKLANCNEQRLERGIQQRISHQKKQDELVAGYGCALADSNSSRSGKDWESSESRATRFEQSSEIAGRGDAGKVREEHKWPSRPSEPQHAWEPPRTVKQTQPALGGNADGPAGGLDYGQLCRSSDNRTDELRMLGNRVVPATAEQAFRTLITELVG